ncbi:MAG: hypothetical protein JXO72_09940, partial [Vicinamibacteria bacterium]|nr:hypothetical protein [Vicinamibacteria bacterium]
MSEESAGKRLLSVEEIAAAAAAVASMPDFEKMARRLLDQIQEWAAPSVVACLRKDQGGDQGWRMVPELVLGTVTPAFERSIIRLIEEAAPASLEKPVLVRPQDEMPGSQVKVRDNWIVPCRAGNVIGYLFMRGIGHPYPVNLGQAVELASQALWFRLSALRPGAEDGRSPSVARGDLTHLDALVSNLQGVSESLMVKLRDERERIRSEGDQQAAALRERDAEVAAERARLLDRVEQLTARISALEGEKAASLRENETLKSRVEELSRRPEVAAAESAPAE